MTSTNTLILYECPHFVFAQDNELETLSCGVETHPSNERGDKKFLHGDIFDKPIDCHYELPWLCWSCQNNVEIDIDQWRKQINMSILDIRQKLARAAREYLSLGKLYHTLDLRILNYLYQLDLPEYRQTFSQFGIERRHWYQDPAFKSWTEIMDTMDAIRDATNSPTWCEKAAKATCQEPNKARVLAIEIANTMNSLDAGVRTLKDKQTDHNQRKHAPKKNARASKRETQAKQAQKLSVTVRGQPQSVVLGEGQSRPEKLGRLNDVVKRSSELGYETNALSFTVAPSQLRQQGVVKRRFKRATDDITSHPYFKVAMARKWESRMEGFGQRFRFRR